MNDIAGAQVVEMGWRGDRRKRQITLEVFPREKGVVADKVLPEVKQGGATDIGDVARPLR
jgi:hypothetical protein